MVRRLVALLVLLAGCHAACAAEAFGTVDALTGSASVTGRDGASTAAAVGLKIYEGDTISSAHDGEVHIVTEDGGVIALRPDTVFRVDRYRALGGADDTTVMSLLSGAVRSITGWIGKHDHSAYRLSTPTATLGIRGTDHEVTVIDKGNGDEPGTYDTVNEGATVMKTPHGEAEVAPGKFAFAPKGGAAAPVILAQRPRFWSARNLRIEDRIQQRKEFMRGRLEQMRDERIKSLQGARSEPRGSGTSEERPSAARARTEVGERRLEQATRQGQERYEPRWAGVQGAGSGRVNPPRRRQGKHAGHERR